MADNSSLSNNLVPGLKFRIHGSSRELCQCSETSVQKAGAATKCAEAYALLAHLSQWSNLSAAQKCSFRTKARTHTF